MHSEELRQILPISLADQEKAESGQMVGEALSDGGILSSFKLGLVVHYYVYFRTQINGTDE